MTTTAHGAPSDAQRDAPTIGKLADSMELDRSEGLPRPAMVATVREVRERLRRIEAVTDVALSKLTTEDLLDELLARLQELLDVDTAATLLLDESGQFLSPVASRGLEEEVRHGVRIPFGRGFAGRVAAEARPIAIAEVTPSNVINPILLRKKVRSLLGVPLLVGDTVLGVLHVGTLRPRAFSDEDTAVLQLAADRAAGAISARRSYIDRAAAASLQRSLAPRRLPDIPGYQLAARYVPGSQYGVSGDWYDLFTLPDDRIGDRNRRRYGSRATRRHDHGPDQKCPTRLRPRPRRPGDCCAPSRPQAPTLRTRADGHVDLRNSRRGDRSDHL